jgi:uncharacterized protein YjbI with pentapeptide repeats
MRFLDWLTKHPSRFFLVALFITSLLLFVIDIVIGFTQPSDWRGVLTEAHGMWLDIFVLGLLLTIYENLRNKKENIERYIEELNDYSHWNEEEALYRTMGIIKRLNKLKYNKIDLYYLFLRKSILSEIVFKNNKIEGNNFDFSVIKNTIFKETKMINNSLNEAYLMNNEFANCMIENISSLSRVEQSEFNLTMEKHTIAIQRGRLLKGMHTDISIYDVVFQEGLRGKAFNLILDTVNGNYKTYKKGVIFENCKITKRSSIKHSFFSMTLFKKLLFENATISDTIILSSDFDSVEIIGALIFKKTMFSGIHFINSDLTNCKFVDCQFRDVTFENCKVELTNILTLFHSEITIK